LRLESGQDRTPRLKFNGPWSISNPSESYAEIRAVNDNGGPGAGAGASLRFFTSSGDPAALTEKLTITGSGIISVPTQSAVSLGNTAPFTVNNCEFTKVPFNTLLYDRQGEFDIAMSRFFTKVGGDYLFCSSFFAGDSYPIELDVFINGTRKNGFAISLNSLANGSIVVHLNQGDYAEVFLYQSSGITKTYTGNNVWNWLTINKIN
jgi:hypothetical protein